MNRAEARESRRNTHECKRQEGGAARDAITVRMDAEKRAAPDALARAAERDRSDLINEAADACLAVHRWQIAHIEEGLRQAEASEFATDEEVAAAYARRR